MRAIWANKIAGKEKKALLRFLKRQLIFALTLTMLMMIIKGHSAAWSTWLGGMLAFVPNVVCAFYFFTRRHAQHPNKIVRACYTNEILKIAMICVFFVLILHYTVIQLPFFLIGLMGTYSAYIFIGL